MNPIFEWTLFGIIVINVLCSILELSITDSTVIFVMDILNYYFCAAYLIEALIKVHTVCIHLLYMYMYMYMYMSSHLLYMYMYMYNYVITPIIHVHVHVCVDHKRSLNPQSQFLRWGDVTITIIIFDHRLV